MPISFKTTYDEKGNPQRVNISGRSFESGKTYEADPNNTSRVIDSDTGADVPTNEERRQQFSSVLDYLQDADISNVTPDNITQLKDELKGFPITTTDPNEQRNAFQLFVNSMLGNNRGAKPIDTRNFTGLFDGADNFFDLRRTGPETFINPDVDPSITRDIFSLLTGRENPRVFNLNDIPKEIGGGIANIDYGQEGKDKAAELGIKDYGALFEGLVKAGSPLKYLDFVLNPAKDALEAGGDMTGNLLEKATTPIDYAAELLEKMRTGLVE